MAMSRDDEEFRQQMQRLETLLEESAREGDPAARARSRSVVQAVLDLHAGALERMLEQIAASGPAGLALIDTIAKDDLVGSLLLLYNLHPLDMETRVRNALDQVRPYLRGQGGNVELISFADGVVRLRIEKSGHGCASTGMKLKQAAEEAIYGKAPDVAAIEIEGVDDHANQATFIPAEELMLRNGHVGKTI